MKNRPRFLNLVLVFVFVFSALGFVPKPVLAAPSALRISQVYGGGGNTGATYTHDFIEIFNAGDAAVSLDGLSLQYASATGTGNFGASSTQLTVLPNVTLQPGQYFLVQEAGGSIGIPLPTPDYIDDPAINLSGTAGKVVLATGTTTLGCNGGSNPCSPEQLARIIDLVGYGTANFFEGTAAAPTLSNTTAALRADGGCTDTDDNAADFTAVTPAPRNTASPLNLCVSSPGIIRISQLYGGGGNTGATYTHDFIELFNAGGAPVDITGWSVQYASSTGTTWQMTALSGTIPAGGYYLIQQAQGSGGTTALPTPDAIGVIPMAATNGKVALVNHSTALAGACPLSADVIDFVGFGTANCYEGTGATPALSNTTAGFRKGDGCIDTDDNAADFFVDPPAPRNSASPVNVCGLIDPAPSVTSTQPADSAVNVPLDANIVITFDKPVTLTNPWFDITCADSGTHTATVTNNNPEFTLDPDVDFDKLETCTVMLASANIAAEDTDPPITMAADYSFSFTTLGECGDAYTPIYDIQGSGMTTPLMGQVVTTEGIVVGDFQEGGKNGFYIQDPVGDGNPETSDGIFVYAPGSMEVYVGDHLRVQGTAGEYFGLTQISSVSGLWLCAANVPLPAPTEVTMPVPSVDYYERYEGMLVTFPQDLVISEYFNFDRYGEIMLTTERFTTPTALYAPGTPEVFAAMEAYTLGSITLDDGRTNQNPDPAIHPNGLEFNLYNRFRGGDLVTNLTGIMDYSFNLYRIQPTQGANYTSVNQRPEQPDIIPGDIKVANFNVLNYFTTIDTGSWICGPSGNMECRGADNAVELERQRAKILSAISIMDADVVGLIEIENDRPGPDPDYAVADLVEGLNDIMGADTYDYIATGAIGTDAIKVALIYKPANVTPLGDYAILDTSVNPLFLDNYNRPVLAQTFTSNTVGESVIVAVNHLKSKGSSCAAIGDPDLGDGAGNCNITRTNAAKAQVQWLESDPTDTGVEHILIIGDLNSYDKEDPINAIKAGPDETPGTADDYFDMIYEILGEHAYSYVFDGRTGYLDYAMVNAHLQPFVTDVHIWLINADEPDILDYDTSFKAPAQQAIYAPDAYRASDHDPVIITLTFNQSPVAMDDFYETDQDVTLVVDAPGVLANDGDLNVNDILILDVRVQPKHGQLTLNQDGSFTYIPNPQFYGVDTFVYDLLAIPPGMTRGEYVDSATVTITVHPKYKFHFPIFQK
jgi:predicted extracellular nuclease